MRAAMLCLLAFIAGLTLPEARAGLIRLLPVLPEISELLEARALSTVPADQLWVGAVGGFLKALGDPYSYYLSPDEYRELKSVKSGEIAGVGMEIGMRAGQLTLMSVLPDTPAARAGLKSGDQILAIGTRRTAGLTFTAALRLLQGPEDSWLELSVLPLSSPRSRTLRLRRERLKLEPVTARMLTNQVAYVRIQSLFPDQVPEALQQALTGLEQAGMTALILDLRDNPGGTLHNAIETGSVFLAQGPIVRVRDRQDQETLHEATGLPLVDSGVELVVLVNGGTASAAEIVAASLQEHGRARLVGRTTFGKGRVQRVLSLSNGAGLSLTTSTYLTAHGHDLQGRGIVPDFEVADDLREGDPVLAFARHLLAPLPQ